jgi:mRNA interferase RelE/StbE
LPWIIEWDNKAKKELRCLDTEIQKRIVSYLGDRATDNPKNFGRALYGDKAGLWRYRIGDFRVICSLEDHKLKILVVAVGHRKEIYD